MRNHQEPKSEARNDGLAVMALITGWTVWPIGLILGHVSNKAAKRANRKRSALSVIGLVGAYLWVAGISILIIAGIAGSNAGSLRRYRPPTSTRSGAPLARLRLRSSGLRVAAPASPPRLWISAFCTSDLGSGFSKAGLIAQLDSPDGGQFSVADATWAANVCGADWNAQAVMAARATEAGPASSTASSHYLIGPDGGSFLRLASYAAAVGL